ncbi:MAG: hypothetical protein V4691_02040 [Pseudomonadota bacterium]
MFINSIPYGQNFSLGYAGMSSFFFAMQTTTTTYETVQPEVVCTPPPACIPTPPPVVCAPTPPPPPPPVACAPTPQPFVPYSGLCVPFNGLNFAGAGYFGQGNTAFNFQGNNGYTQGQLARKVVVPTSSAQFGELGPQNYLGTAVTRVAGSNQYGMDQYSTPQGVVGFNTIKGTGNWVSPTRLRA